MRFALVALTLVATPAMACNPEMLTVTDWQAVPNENSSALPVLLKADLRYDGDRAFRMIHAGVVFSDVLDQPLGQVNLHRDLSANPGDALVADRQTGAKKRILTINRDDITHRTCVWSIVYDDGTVEKF